MKHIFIDVQPPSKSEQYVLNYIESYEDASGQLSIPRLGFLALPIIPRTRGQHEP